MIILFLMRGGNQVLFLPRFVFLRHIKTKIDRSVSLRNRPKSHGVFVYWPRCSRRICRWPWARWSSRRRPACSRIGTPCPRTPGTSTIHFRAAPRTSGRTGTRRARMSGRLPLASDRPASVKCQVRGRQPILTRSRQFRLRTCYRLAFV